MHFGERALPVALLGESAFAVAYPGERALAIMYLGDGHYLSCLPERGH